MTEEMEKMVYSSEKHIVCQAYAGAGKTSTMVEYIKHHPDESILLIVFNKSASLDVAKRLKSFRNNCKVSTIHSVAYNWYIRNKGGKKPIKNISLIDIRTLLRSRLEYYELSKIKFYLDMFLASKLDTPQELELLDSDDKYLIKYVSKVWDILQNTDFITHSVYLKMYQLAKVKLNYDTIILDEANDCNSVMLDLLLTNLDKKIIAVGDSKQTIMCFSHTIDALSILKNEYGFKEYTITNSFRVSERVADIASRYLTFSSNENIKFKGMGNTRIGRLNLLEANAKTNQIHLLCRNRLGGLGEVIELLEVDKSKKIYYFGGLEAYGVKEMEKLKEYKNYCYLGGIKFHISDLYKMRDDGADDYEINTLLSYHSFMKKNEDIIELLKHTETKNIEEADIVVLTSHVSKGLTLENVLIGRDFPTVEEIVKTIEATEWEHQYTKNLALAERNLLYVAMTRATNVVDFGSALKKESLLTKKDKIKVEKSY